MAECPHIDRSSVSEQMFEKVTVSGYTCFRSRISGHFVQFCQLVKGAVDYPEMCADGDLAQRECPWYSRGVLEGK